MNDLTTKDTKGTKGKELRSLPEGWVWTTLGEVADLVGGGTPSREKPEYFTGNYVWLTPTEIPKNKIVVVSDSRERINDDALHHSSARLIPKGSVLMTSRASIGYVAIAGTEVTTNQGFASFLPKEGVNNFFLAYWLWANASFFIEQGTGTTFKEITKSKLRTFSLPLPPLPEQERIVASLEELLSDLEAGVAALERVRAGVKRYKASVLKVACEGKLFDVGAHGMRPSVQAGRTPSAPTGVGGLPEGWRWVKMDEIADTIGGVTKGRNLTGKATIMLPYLRVANVQRGRLDLDVMKEIEIFASEVGKYRLQDGDVVLTEGGDWDKLGRSAIWRNQIPDCIHQNHIFRARVKSSDVLPEWLMYFTNSEPGQYYFKEAAKQTTNLASINLTQLRACPIPLPPLEEQQRIVADAERRLESARAVESAVEVGLKRAGRLRQAVLRSAFEGRL